MSFRTSRRLAVIRMSPERTKLASDMISISQSVLTFSATPAKS